MVGGTIGLSERSGVRPRLCSLHRGASRKTIDSWTITKREFRKIRGRNIDPNQ